MDGWHLLKRSREAVRAEQRETGEAAALLSRLSQLLWRGQVEEALVVVRAELNGQAGAELATYLDHQRAWIGTAEAGKASGGVIGGGAVERAVDLGMSWTRSGAEAIVAL